ncbi:hypothetical protein HAX54_004349 [Datura stramonium]|uniref:Uncharacterized protein n=1 Tax=Datura stramonium TaxID=4076 RepID=A0ABS8RUD3_DATST|nr:hypothetical protein [Datura stramonium]
MEKQLYGKSGNQIVNQSEKREAPAMEQWPTLTSKEGMVTPKSNQAILIEETQRSQPVKSSEQVILPTIDSEVGHKCQKKKIPKASELVSKWMQKPSGK